MTAAAMPPLPAIGDRVAVVAPSGPVLPERIERGLAWLRSLGLRPEPGAQLRGAGRHGLRFLAGSDDAARAAELQEAWCDPDIAAVLCARGGSGSPRLLDLLDWDALATARPKPLVGQSDVTVLQQAFATRLGVATLWAPMPCTTVLCGPDADPLSQARFADALLGRDGTVLHGTVLVAGRVTAPLVGGTLTLLSATVGTPEATPAAGAIAVLEDVAEAPYRIERMLTHLRRAGWFDGAVGVACGRWTRCGEPGEVVAVLHDRLGDLGIPVLVDLDIGHGTVQSSLWFGRHATLDGATLVQRRQVS